MESAMKRAKASKSIESVVGWREEMHTGFLGKASPRQC